MAERIVILNGDHPGSEYRLEKGPYTVGSGDNCSIPILGEGVQEEHAILERIDDGWRITPPHRHATILINGERCHGAELSHGEIIECGEIQLRFAANWVTLTSIPLAEVDMEDAEELAAEINQTGKRALRYLARVVRDQPEACYALVVSLLARGHVLLGGRPGMGKTLLVDALGGLAGLRTAHMQAFPDMMRGDLVGDEVMLESSKDSKLELEHGPIFSELLRVGNLHRAPGRIISTLSKAMRHGVVRFGEKDYPLPNPFMVIGTYDEAESSHGDSSFLCAEDAERYMLCLHLRFPSHEEEQRVVQETTEARPQEIKRLLSPEFILRAQSLTRQMKVSERVALYASSLARATRPHDSDAPEFIEAHVKSGCGLNAARQIVLAAKAHALLQGRTTVSCDDCAAFAVPVLRHRMMLKTSAQKEGVTPGNLVERLVEIIAKPANLESSYSG